MPRVSRAQTELNRVKIMQTATRLFRERGIQGITLSEVMNESGLTNGGFYGHFASKEALVNEACAQAFEQSAIAWREKVAVHSKKSRARKAIVDHYLVERKRDQHDGTCPVVALSGEMAHEDEQSAIHQTYLRGLKTLISTYMSTIESDDLAESEGAKRQTALVEYSLMIGAMTLARAAGQAPISGEIIKAAKAFLSKDCWTPPQAK
ncbi:TetR/AcrR family transcriptional regulator [Pseudomonas gingeri]|uniref:TetR/AcrR family transcriptional regulator n=3 Tax=Pseudomonas gingeri TaxID=117681 RepID=A0A7Y7XBI1_9PSED|nr:TetR/AcrR family transcriptional regulator [Pseudomonas gingeri]NWB95683.1 TetR/AcrR family transcriptional regulator [Pseudomonas gingeri]NWD72644.1 TetR/AcrR family transcriptional regulator [Pseudomonas gingeri]